MEKVTKRVASMLLSGEAKSVVVLTGAGVSTGAGLFLHIRFFPDDVIFAVHFSASCTLLA